MEPTSILAAADKLRPFPKQRQHSLSIEDVVTVPDPRIVQLVSHSGSELFALDEAGNIFVRERDQKDFNQGPQNKPVFLWRPIVGPHGV